MVRWTRLGFDSEVAQLISHRLPQSGTITRSDPLALLTPTAAACVC